MRELQITNIKLQYLQVTMNEVALEFEPDNIQAMLQIEHNFDNPEKQISYDIIVGESVSKYLFTLKCSYQFSINITDFIDEEVIKEAMRLLEPHIEELLAFVSMEGGFLTDIKN
jgi:hypothetical protein